MDVYEAVRTVLAVRTFQDKAVPAVIKNRILDAARLTCGGSNQQPLHFILIEDRARLQQLGTIAKSGPYTTQAAFAIVVVIEHSNMALSDGSRAIQSMVLTAWAEGVGSNWVGFVPIPEVNKLLDIPETYDVLAVIPFGYPVKKSDKGRRSAKHPKKSFIAASLAVLIPLSHNCNESYRVMKLTNTDSVSIT